jgi:DNA primase
MRIPEETVRLIQQTADIVDVVGDYVSLKKRGVNLIACCPFHNEKTPSFNVNPVRGIYKCFGCGKAGDSVKFIMDIEGISFPEALRHLAKKYGIEIPETQQTPEDVAAQNERESLYIALNHAKNFYQNQLTGTDEGRGIGLSYFKERGFNDKTIQTFELGYSPDAWDGFTKAALKAGYTLDILEKAGLSIRRDLDGRPDARVFDRFRARVIFPIHNLSGKVIAFGARILKADKNQPKYLNSPETEVYHKSNVLYGIFQAKNSIRAEEVAYLVEGYTDVISLHQAGIQNVVASSGTALTVEQIRLIGRFSPNVTVLYDGDAAGVKASLRGMDLILEEGLNVKLCLFPDGDDPDSYVRKIGGEAFKAYVRQHAVDFITFKAQLSLDEAGTDPFKRAEVIKDMVGSIAKIPDAIKRQVFFQKTAQLMGIDEAVLIAEANRRYLSEKKGGATGRTKAEEPSVELPEGVSLPEADEQHSGQAHPPSAIRTLPSRTPLSRHEEEFCRLLVCYGNHELEPGVTLAQYLLGEIGGLEFETPVYRTIVALARDAFARGEVPDAQEYLMHPDDGIRAECISLVTQRYSLSDNWKSLHDIHVPDERELLDRLAFSNLLRLKKAFNEQRMEAVKAALAQATEATEQDRLLGQFMEMKRIDKALAGELGIVVKR